MTTNSSRIRLVVFDWAGTTIDFGSRAPAQAFKKVFASRGVEVSDAEAREPMGLNKREHLVAMLSSPEIATRWETAHGRAWTDSDVDGLYDEFVPFQLQAIEETAELVPGLVEVLKTLREREIHVVGTTGYFREAAELVASHAAEAGYTPTENLCADDVRTGRPAPWMIFEAMHRTNVYPSSRVLKVGDTVADIGSGLNANCWSVGVCDSSSVTGLSRDEYAALSDSERRTRLTDARITFESAGAHATLPTIGELPTLIDSLNARLQAGELPASPAALTATP